MNMLGPNTARFFEGLDELLLQLAGLRIDVNRIVEEGIAITGGALTPAGVIAAYGGSVAPVGWVLCDGMSYATALYPALFAAIGHTYGGSGLTFSVPDLRGRFPLGKAVTGTGSTLGATGGTIDHTHSGTTGLPSDASPATPTVVGLAASPTHTHSFTTSAANPPFIALNFIIKV